MKPQIPQEFIQAVSANKNQFPAYSANGDPLAQSFNLTDSNLGFEERINDLIWSINNGHIDGQLGERQIFQLREEQQRAQNNYKRTRAQERQDEIRAQSPAMAQRQSTSSFYDARTGRPLNQSQIDRVRQQERDQMIQMGENPYDIHSAEGKFWESKNNTLNPSSTF